MRNYGYTAYQSVDTPNAAVDLGVVAPRFKNFAARCPFFLDKMNIYLLVVRP